jgi:hypothetical protein
VGVHHGFPAPPSPFPRKSRRDIHGTPSAEIAAHPLSANLAWDILCFAPDLSSPSTEIVVAPYTSPLASSVEIPAPYASVASTFEPLSSPPPPPPPPLHTLASCSRCRIKSPFASDIATPHAISCSADDLLDMLPPPRRPPYDPPPSLGLRLAPPMTSPAVSVYAPQQSAPLPCHLLSLSRGVPLLRPSPFGSRVMCSTK